MPVFLLVERADNESDYAARVAIIRNTLGPEADALFGQILDYTRRLDI